MMRSSRLQAAAVAMGYTAKALAEAQRWRALLLLLATPD